MKQLTVKIEATVKGNKELSDDISIAIEARIQQALGKIKEQIKEDFDTCIVFSANTFNS